MKIKDKEYDWYFDPSEGWCNKRGIIDYSHYKKMDFWEIGVAISLLCRIDPKSIFSLKEKASLTTFIDKAESFYLEEKDFAHNVIEHVKSSIKSGKLNYLPGSESVKPSEFIQWALTKKLYVPKELRSLTKGPKTPDVKVPPYLDLKNPYYAPELANAVKAWEGIYLKPGVIKTNRSYINQIKEWLKKYCPDLKSEEARDRVAKVINIAKRKNGGALSIDNENVE